MLCNSQVVIGADIHNLLTPLSDYHLISPYNITPELTVKVRKMIGKIKYAITY